MPGLIDAHVHVKATGLNFSVLERTPVAYLVGQACQIMKGMLARGFTTVRDAEGADWGLANAVEEVLKPRGVAVVSEAAHLCMMMRGVAKQSSMTTTSCMLGAFREDSRTRSEFLSLIGGPGRGR